MTGSEFRAIRRFNRLSQADITARTSYKSDSAVKEIERSSKVPHVFVNLLSNLFGLDLSKEDNLRKMLEGIPEKYFHVRVSTRQYHKFPAVFVPRGSIFGN